MNNNDYLLGQLSTNVAALLVDVKEIKQSLEELKLWKAKVVIASSLCSVAASTIFYLAITLFQK